MPLLIPNYEKPLLQCDLFGCHVQQSHAKSSKGLSVIWLEVAITGMRLAISGYDRPKDLFVPLNIYLLNLSFLIIA